MYSNPAATRAVPVSAAPSLSYFAKQAFLWLAVPLALYLVFVTQIPAVHDATHSVRHAAGFLKCH